VVFGLDRRDSGGKYPGKDPQRGQRKPERGAFADSGKQQAFDFRVGAKKEIQIR
jgi:hypothetical protein